MEHLTRDDILDGDDHDYAEITVPSWGTVRLRSMDVPGLQRWEALQAQEPSTGELLAWLVRLTVTNGNGELLFTDDDIARLQEKNPKNLRLIAEAAQQLLITDDAIEDAAKNSAGGQS